MDPLKSIHAPTIVDIKMKCAAQSEQGNDINTPQLEQAVIEKLCNLEVSTNSIKAANGFHPDKCDTKESGCDNSVVTSTVDKVKQDENASDVKTRETAKCVLDPSRRITRSQSALLNGMKEQEGLSVVSLRRCPSDAELAAAMTTQLHDAVRRRDIQTVERLLKEGADPDEPDWTGTGDAPILQAVAAGSIDIVRALCAAGCDVNSRTARGESALHLALTSRRPFHPGLVDTLLDAGCDANIHENLQGLTALHAFARHMSPNPPMDTFSHLARCTNVNLRDHRKRTPLHRLVGAGITQLDPYKVLLSAGADPSLQSDRGETPLLEALEKDSASLDAVILLLISSGTDLTLYTAYMETALHLAARKNRSSELITTLLQHGAPTNARDLRGNTALHLAAGRGYVRIVSLLLSAPGIELNASNKEGLTPLHVAVESGFIQVVKLLLEAEQCDLTARTKLSLTPLDLAQQEYRRRSQPEMSLVLIQALERRGLQGAPIAT